MVAGWGAGGLGREEGWGRCAAEGAGGETAFHPPQLPPLPQLPYLSSLPLLPLHFPPPLLNLHRKIGLVNY